MQSATASAGPPCSESQSLSAKIPSSFQQAKEEIIDELDSVFACESAIGFDQWTVEPWKLSTHDKLRIFCGRQRCDLRKLKFPTRLEYGKQRSFQPQWLETYPWLFFSAKAYGGFCLSCILFSSGTGGPLSTKPMTNFTKAAATLSKHSKQKCHLDCVVRSDAFIMQMRRAQPDVVQQLHDVASHQGQENKLCTSGGRFIVVLRILPIIP